MKMKTGRQQCSKWRGTREPTWLGENIEDTVPDHLGIGGDVVSSIGETPSDGVEKPEKREDRGRDGEGSLETATEHSGGTSGRAEEYPPDLSVSGGFSDFRYVVTHVEFCCTTKGKVSPLVRCRHEGAYKASDDHDKVHEDCANHQSKSQGSSSQTHVKMSERGRAEAIKRVRSRAGVVY